MIGYLEGTVKNLNNSSLLLVVGGVGYKLLCPLPALVSLTEGVHVSLFVHTHVREDQITLFGFKDESDLFLFEKLTSVSGIGPKSALSVLSLHSPASLAFAIENNDIEAISKTPGIGKKTAEKVILELRGKLAHLAQGESKNSEQEEAKLALETLGYTAKEIGNALKEVDPTNKTTSTIIKEALQQLQ